jgi:hypothetical protein
MPQIIEVPGFGDVEFPDDMTDDQIAAAIKANMSPQRHGTGKSLDVMADGSMVPSESVHYTGSGVVPASSGIAQRERQYGPDAGIDLNVRKEDVQNVVSAAGVPVRGAWKGLTSLPGLAADAGVGARNLITGSNYELPTQMQERSLDQYLPLPGVPGDKTLEFASSLLGGAKLPLPQAANQAPKGFVKPGHDVIRQQTLKDAQAAGYVVPPSTTNPTRLNQILESIAGKTATAQEAAMRNQDVTNTLAKKAVGLSEQAPISPGALSAVRSEAGDAYATLRQVGNVTLDNATTKTLDGIASKFTGNKLKTMLGGGNDIPAVVQAIKDEPLNGDTAVDVISLLRDKASQAYSSGSKETGKAYKGLSEAVETLMERNLSGDALKAFREARTQIAKTYSVEGALNESTGNVVASKLAAQLAKKKPLTGDLRTAARFGQAFPQAAQSINNSGPVHHLDSVMAGGTAAITREPWWLMYPFIRQGVRSGLLSQQGQALATPSASTGIPPGLLGAGLVTEEELRRQLAGN